MSLSNWTFRMWLRMRGYIDKHTKPTQKMNEMISTWVAKTARHGMTTLGGWLAAKGYLDAASVVEQTTDSVVTISVGLAMIAAGFAWSYVQAWLDGKKKELK